MTLGTVIRAGETKVTVEPQRPRTLAQSPEHIRLGMVRMVMDGPATLRRISREQMFVESITLAVSTRGVSMPGTMALITSMRDLSSGMNGLGIDAAVKMLSPVPAMGIPGSAFQEDQKPGLIDRFVSFVTGSGSDNKQ